MRNNFPVILSLIVALGAVLRLFNLVSLPPSLNWDEVSHGYNAYSILKTGKDQWGELLPIFNFRAYGDYPLPLNLYLTIPFIAVLGLSEFAIRLPHALLGVGTIIATYYFVRGFTKKENLALLASLLVSVDPWTLFTSRFVLQSNISVFLLASSGAFFFNREKKKFFLPLAILLLGLTLYSYHTTRIVSPLILISTFAIYWKEVKLNYLSIAIIILLFVPGIYALMRPEARARSGVVFLLNESASNKIVSLRQQSKLPDFTKRLFYNKATYFAWNFGGNYLDYFSPEFLFFKGGTQYQFSVPGFGVLNIASLPFFYIGLLWLVKKAKDEKDFQLVAAWLFLAPIPASITVDKFAVLRSTPMLPIPELLSALGFFITLSYLKKIKWVLIVVYFIALAYSLETYMAKYVGDYTKNYSWSWQYGYKQIVNYAKENYDKYDKIIVTKKYGEPHEFFLFFLAYDPAKYQDGPAVVRFYQSNWWWVDHFDKFWFVNDWQVRDLVTESKQIIDCINTKCLLITSPGNYPSGPPTGEVNWSKINEVNFLDGKRSFEIYEN